MKEGNATPPELRIERETKKQPERFVITTTIVDRRDQKKTAFLDLCFHLGLEDLSDENNFCFIFVLLVNPCTVNVEVR